MNKVNESDVEFDKYKKENKVIYLQQACNKLFSAVENFLMIKYSRRYKNYQDIKRMVSGNRVDSLLLSEAVQLHYFYYNGDLQMDRYDAETLYKEVRRKLKNRIGSGS